jgi:hypothetical protein
MRAAEVEGISSMPSAPGMSKRTSYGKIYRPDVRGCRPNTRARPRLPRGRIFTHGRVFTVRADDKKTSLRAQADAFARIQPCVRADKSASAQTRPCVRADIGPSARINSTPCPASSPVPPYSPCVDGLICPR